MAYIGTWDFPSGNRVEVHLDPDTGQKTWLVRCEWHRFPPSRWDRRYYQAVVADAIYRRVAEYLEVPPAKMLVVQGE